MEAEEMLTELAAMEGNGKPALPMLRVECGCACHTPQRKVWGHVGPNSSACSTLKHCPGYRAKTLDDARPCLAELLAVMYKTPSFAEIHKWHRLMDSIVDGMDESGSQVCMNTPTEVILFALYEANRITTDA